MQSLNPCCMKEHVAQPWVWSGLHTSCKVSPWIEWPPWIDVVGKYLTSVNNLSFSHFQLHHPLHGSSRTGSHLWPPHGRHRFDGPRPQQLLCFCNSLVHGHGCIGSWWSPSHGLTSGLELGFNWPLPVSGFIPALLDVTCVSLGPQHVLLPLPEKYLIPIKI